MEGKTKPSFYIFQSLNKLNLTMQVKTKHLKRENHMWQKGSGINTDVNLNQDAQREMLIPIWSLSRIISKKIFKLNHVMRAP